MSSEALGKIKSFWCEAAKNLFSSFYRIKGRVNTIMNSHR
jgi:hypothetical protein